MGDEGVGVHHDVAAQAHNWQENGKPDNDLTAYAHLVAIQDGAPDVQEGKRHP